ncbi:MAG: MATE family efflux transporter [Bacteroidales bacterium]|nr:MATE family efflux transporter [Bacteroidales bacterium]
MNRQILKLALPFIISNITVPLVSSVDTALMGNFGSTAQMGAIGLGGAIFNFLYWNFAFIRMSVVGLTAQQLGAKNNIETSMLLGRSLFVALIGSLLLVIFQAPIGQIIFSITQGEAEVENFALEYFRLRIWDAPATICLMALSGWFVGMQNARAPMMVALLINSVNIFLSYIFVAKFGMHARGIAMGTVIAQYCGLLLALAILLSKYKNTIKHIFLIKVLELKGYRRFFQVNIDVFVRTLAVILVLTWYNFASAGKGNIILGINVIFLQLVFAFSFFTDGFANAAEALTGKFFGAGDKQKLKRTVHLLFVWGFSIALAFTLVYMFAWEHIFRIFTNDDNVIRESARYVGWIIAMPLVSILTFIWDGVFLGTTATREQRNATVIAALLFFAVYYFLEPYYANHALLFAQLVFFGMRGILQSFLYKPAILNKIDCKRL